MTAADCKLCHKGFMQRLASQQKLIEQLEAENKSLKEVLHYGNIETPMVAVIGKAMEEKSLAAAKKGDGK
jgi:hypothetical protein